MTDTPIVTEPTIEPKPATILQRIAVPFFSFSAVLFLSLLTSRIFLLPRLTTFTVGGMNVSVDEGIAYERSLRAEVTALEDTRTQLVLPYIDDTYDMLMRERRATPSIVTLRRQIESAMENVAVSAGAHTSIDAVLFDASTGTVTVRGAVTDPHPSSMAVLAAGVDAVQKISGVTDLVAPPLTRDALPDGTYRSPFTFSFTIQL